MSVLITQILSTLIIILEFLLKLASLVVFDMDVAPSGLSADLHSIFISELFTHSKQIRTTTVLNDRDVISGKQMG